MSEKRKPPPGIREHRGRYQVRYYGSDGRRHAQSFERLTDAKRFQRAVETDKLRGEWHDPRAGRIGFRDYAQEWAATKANVRARTRLNIEGRLRTHILPAFGDRKIGTIQPLDVRAWVAGLSAKGLAPSTVRAIYRTLGQILRTAEIDGLIARSPCLGVELPAETSTEEMRFLSASEIAALADAHDDDPYRVAIFTAAYTGLRAGELWALRLPRVNLLKRRLEVVESLSEVRGKIVTGPTKTKSRRAVTLPTFLAEMIAEHAGRRPSRDGYLFTAAGGGPVRHRNYMARHFGRAVSVAQLPPGLRFHDLRHTCAALLIAQGAHPKAIQARLGHASIRTTLDRYGHLFEGHDAALLESLDGDFREARTGTNGDQMGTTGAVKAFPNASQGPV